MTRNGAVLTGTAIVTAAAAALVLATAPEPGATGRVHADAALVLSGDVDYLRVKRAAALYGQGAVKALLLTGRGIGGDSADEMRKHAIAAGVPDAAIVLERDSTTTHENIVLAGPLIHARGWRRIALVTSRCHLPRALATARTALPDVQWVPVAVQDAGPPSRIRRMVLQELAKRLWYKARGWA